MTDQATPIGLAVFTVRDVASAGTTEIGGLDEWRLRITGTTPITSFGAGISKLRFLSFEGALTLTHNGTTLTLEGGKDIVTQAGDTCFAGSDASSNWTVFGYRRADGHPLITGSTSLASDTTTDLGSLLAHSLTITGTTTITSFGSSAPVGAVKYLVFNGALTLTHNATSLILPTGANITTRASDTALVRHGGSGNWRCLVFQRQEGPAVVLRASGDSIGVGIAADTNYALKVGVAGSSVAGLRGISVGGVQIGTSGGGYGQVGQNFRFSSTTGADTYNVSDVANKIDFNTGGFYFQTAISGTAGNAITWNNAFSVDATGLLHHYNTTDATAANDAGAEFEGGIGVLKKAFFGDAIRVPNGTAAAPSIGIGAADKGFYATSTQVGGAVSGVAAFTSGSNDFAIERDASISVTIGRYQDSASAAIEIFQRSRGTKASPTAMNNGDIIGQTRWNGRGNSAYVIAAQWTVSISEATPSDTAMGTLLTFSLCPVGSGTATEIFRFGHASGFSMFGANPVIDQNRLHVIRSATLGTIISAAAGKVQFLTDLGGGANAIIHDGTGNKRLGNGGYQVNNTDAAFTLTPLTDAVNVKHTGTLTADRAVTLASGRPGDEFWITRTGAGAFNLNVGTGPLKALATNTWGRFVCETGTTWYLAAYGAL